MLNENLQSFLELISSSYYDNSFIKLTLSKTREKGADLSNCYIQLVLIKEQSKVSFVFHHKYKDVTKNFSLTEALKQIEQLLTDHFYNANLIIAGQDIQYLSNKKGNARMLKNNNTLEAQIPVAHDRQKKRFLQLRGNKYFKELGITSENGQVKSTMQDKYRQIEKYVDIIDSIMHEVNMDDINLIADMGCGKGYLTFALYDHLTNNLGLMPTVLGVEMRKELVDKCNDIAANSDFDQLAFMQGTIKDVNIPSPDMLIALHACDTATDEAIYKGIKGNAEIIICAPCCHKQIRKQLFPKNILHEISKHGILKERLAESVTDSIRALMLEAYGYSTKVFEFISSEHTPKNVLIVGVKNKTVRNNFPIKSKIDAVNELKEMFNIKLHELQELLLGNN